jgi:hypothetical protein
MCLVKHPAEVPHDPRGPFAHSSRGSADSDQHGSCRNLRGPFRISSCADCYFTPSKQGERTIQQPAVEAAFWGMPLVNVDAMRQAYSHARGWRSCRHLRLAPKAPLRHVATSQRPWGPSGWQAQDELKRCPRALHSVLALWNRLKSGSDESDAYLAYSIKYINKIRLSAVFVNAIRESGLLSATRSSTAAACRSFEMGSPALLARPQDRR